MLAELGKVEQEEMYRVFNMGIGLVLVVPPDQAKAVIRRAGELGDRGYRIGEIVAGPAGEKSVVYV